MSLFTFEEPWAGMAENGTAKRHRYAAVMRVKQNADQLGQIRRVQSVSADCLLAEQLTFPRMSEVTGLVSRGPQGCF